MPKTAKVYPEWVQQYRAQGMTVKKKGDAYYLYKRTSRRVPGKKYPQPVDTYVGIVTPDGIIKTHKKKLELTDIEVWEYGYSKAVTVLCTQGWKNALGEEWPEVLRTLILKWSPKSYLSREGAPKKPEEFHCSFNAQGGLLTRRIFKEHGVDIKDLESLKEIYLVRIGKEEAVSRVSEENKQILDRLGVKLTD